MTKEIEPLESGKLTKKFLMALPENVFLVSNILKKEDVPVKIIFPAFAEKVLPLSKRIYQWQRIREASVDQRRCHVFKTKKDSIKWLKQMLGM